MKFPIRKLIALFAGSPASLSPLAASSEDEKSSSPKSLPAQGLLASLLSTEFSFKESRTSDDGCADSTPASDMSH